MRTSLRTLALFTIITCASSWTLQSGYARDAEPSSGTNHSSDRNLRERVERERNQVMQRSDVRPIAEAISAVEETRKAARLLENNQPEKARESLERAIGKTEIVLANHPALGLVPVTADVRIIDSNANDETIKLITTKARDLVNKGLYQNARLLIRDLASEIDIITVNLPLATYPDAIRDASRSMEQGRLKEARSKLLTALQSLIMVETSIPIPIIRAQALIDEANRAIEKSTFNKDNVNELLEDADQQLIRAEKLGYGNRKQDFSDLHSAIKDTKNSIRKDQDSRGDLSKVKDGLDRLRERAFKAL